MAEGWLAGHFFGSKDMVSGNTQDYSPSKISLMVSCFDGNLVGGNDPTVKIIGSIRPFVMTSTKGLDMPQIGNWNLLPEEKDRKISMQRC
uniref:Uncharacterized protein n=1 Tax=Salix viminalis TaxID=40686 RepID=A0A6N2MH35_SALVM